MLSPALQQILFSGYDSQRNRLANDVQGIAGKVPVAGWLPHRNDGLTSVDPWSGRVWTAESTMQGRLVAQSKGVGLVMNGTSNVLISPDTADASFGNGTTDSGFSIFAVGNATSKAGNSGLLAKYETANQEYRSYITATGTNTLVLELTDNSVPASPLSASNAAIIQGAITSWGLTYDGTGGASALNGALIYQAGAVIASTPVNSGTYVAMENLTGRLDIGAGNGVAAAFFQGTLCAVILGAGVLTAAQIAALHNRCQRYWGF